MIKPDTSENQVKIAYLAIGSNLGNKSLNIDKAKLNLANFKIEIVKSSSKYESLSWPNIKNPTFVNIVLKIKTSYSAEKLLRTCLYVENILGRKREKKNDPRICDIDIIDYDMKVINQKNIKLIVPHPCMHRRNFVLLPLFEINKNWIHSKTKIKIAKLLNSLDIADLRAIKQI